MWTVSWFKTNSKMYPGTQNNTGTSPNQALSIQPLTNAFKAWQLSEIKVLVLFCLLFRKRGSSSRYFIFSRCFSMKKETKKNELNYGGIIWIANGASLMSKHSDEYFSRSEIRGYLSKNWFSHYLLTLGRISFDRGFNVIWFQIWWQYIRRLFDQELLTPINICIKHQRRNTRITAAFINWILKVRLNSKSKRNILLTGDSGKVLYQFSNFNLIIIYIWLQIKPNYKIIISTKMTVSTIFKPIMNLK